MVAPYSIDYLFDVVVIRGKVTIALASLMSIVAPKAEYRRHRHHNRRRRD
jgi:hypothetical protein